MNSDIKQLKVSLIVDSEYISKWEYDAIVYASARSEFKIDSVLYCLNSVSYRQYFKHFFYFALNLVSMRNKWTKRTKWSTLIPDKNRVKRFEAETNGRWQSIPQGIREWLDTSTPDVILKFGMNLLSDPQNLPSKFGVLSFHHGNPTKYRGRPAGFYEILFKEDEIGVIVQRLTNSLDGGEIVSSGNFKLFKHSYKRSLENAYGSGRYLLLKALNNLENHISPDSLGKIYTLPTNYQVANFVLKLLLQKLKWIIGVMFFRKKWSISTTKKSVKDFMVDPDLSTHSATFHTPNRLSFAADPFILENGMIICEVAERGSNVGNLAVIDDGEFKFIDSLYFEKDRHISFPFVTHIEEAQFLLPEMASYGQQRLFELGDNDQILRSIPLLGLEHESLIDPIITQQDGLIWLFAGKLGSDLDCLFLWSTKSIYEPFIEHDMNPIVCSPKFARNAGTIFDFEGHLYRPAQNCTDSYGDGISIMKIEEISQMSYAETLVKTINFSASYGPHTINFGGNIVVFDQYTKVFDPFAWKTKVSI